MKHGAGALLGAMRVFPDTIICDERAVARHSASSTDDGGLHMARFPIDSDRVDPYKNFKFKVKWEDRCVAGFSKMSALTQFPGSLAHRVSDSPESRASASQGPTEFRAITLEHGITHDSAFEAWANGVSDFGAGVGAEVSLKDFRKDLAIDVCNEAGRVAVTYTVIRAWVSELQAIPDLDANGSAIAIAALTLENEGWVRRETESD
jgi:phage tail-like protein